MTRLKLKIFGLNLLILALLVFSLPSAGAPTGASDWVKTDHTEVRLVSSSITVGGAETIQLGVQFRLKPQWKVYWRSPGDAGFPPQLDWTGSKNVANAAVQWPLPKRFSVLGLETLGYKDEVVFPVLIKPQSQNNAVKIETHLRYLTCNDICVPYDAELALTLPAGPQKPSPHAHLISQYQSLVPGDGKIHGFNLLSSDVTESKDAAIIRVAVTSKDPFISPDAYFEGPRELAFTKPKFSYSEDRRSAVLEVKADGLDYLEDDTGKTVRGRAFTVTLLDGKRSAEQKLIIGSPLLDPNQQIAARSGADESEISLFYILAVAVLGGLILNLMPCVLPVLSIKVLGVVGHGGGENRFVRLSFLASAAGILASFMVLAGTLAALKAGGMAIGWGIQFQYPWFLIGMIFLVVLFACNLWGFFEVRLPGFLSSLGAPGQGENPLTSHFMQGALATLLATPCSAPFLGTAIGFAMARGTFEIFAIFFALGTGLALPFLVFALAPSMITRLPRPGIWMARLRFVLGFALAATAAWLISVLVPSVGAQGAGIVTAVMIAITGLLYFANKSKTEIGRANWLTVIALAALAVYAPVKLAPDAIQPLLMQNQDDAIQWQPFDLQAIPTLVANGTTVLVDVTADWCITCKVNKALVFNDGPVAEILAKRGFIAMKADWTLPNPEIAAFLASFRRYGIPFDVIYGPQSPSGRPLPELLSQSTVISALAAAAGDRALAKAEK